MNISGPSPDASSGAVQSLSPSNTTVKSEGTSGLNQNDQVDNKHDVANRVQDPTTQNASMCSSMSTQDFVSLSNLAVSPIEGDAGNMKDLKDMVKMVVALQILQKVAEATSEVIDDFFSSDTSAPGL